MKQKSFLLKGFVETRSSESFFLKGFERRYFFFLVNLKFGKGISLLSHRLPYITTSKFKIHIIYLQ